MIRAWVACARTALCLLVGLATAPTDVLAQVDEGAVLSIKQLPESERLQLRRILAEPTPSDATFATLRLHLQVKERAAELLGDDAAKEAILREAIRLLPKTPSLFNNLGMLLPLRTHSDESLALLEQASESATVATDRAFYTMNLARRLGALNRAPEARNTIKRAESILDTYSIPTSGFGRQTVFRIRAGIAGANSDFAAIEGDREKALRFAGVAADEARRAVDVWVDRSNVNLDNNYFYTLSQLSSALERLGALQLAVVVKLVVANSCSIRLPF